MNTQTLLTTLIYPALVQIVVTFIVGGLVIYFIQKKIDKANAQQLEKFKADLQLANFEQQAKFTSSHAKTVETLQTLYKKLALYVAGCHELIQRTSAYLYAGGEKNVSTSEYEKLSVYLTEFWAYFIENRIFLPDDTDQKVQAIYTWIKFVHEEAYQNLPDGKIGEYSFPSLKYSLKDYEQRFIHKYSEEDWKEIEDYEDFKLFGLMQLILHQRLEEMEDIYRSVAGLK
jgi:hypothetical protein